VSASTDRANQCQVASAFEKGFVAGFGILAQRSSLRMGL